MVVSVWWCQWGGVSAGVKKVKKLMIVLVTVVQCGLWNVNGVDGRGGDESSGGGGLRQGRPVVE